MDADDVEHVGLALGPYAIGRLSGALGSLRNAMLIGLGAYALALLFLLLATPHIGPDEARRLARARAAGETGL